MQRRRDVVHASIGEVELERMLGCPREHLGFHLWFLKEKGWIVRTDRGFAITVEGIDEAEVSRAHLRDDRLLAETAGADASPPRLEAVSGDG